MKKLFLSVTKLLIGVAGISFVSLLTTQPTLAQLGKVDAGGNNSDVQNNNLNFDSGDFNMFDLIHRANLGNTTFDPNRKSQELDEAAKAFRARQNQVNGNQQQRQQGQILPIIISPSVVEPTTQELIVPPKN